MGKKTKQEIICFCNNIPLETIQQAIRDGAKTLNEIYDETTAGIGPCGGSCRRKLAPILEKFLDTGTFDDETAASSCTPDPKSRDPTKM